MMADLVLRVGFVVILKAFKAFDFGGVGEWILGFVACNFIALNFVACNVIACNVDGGAWIAVWLDLAGDQLAARLDGLERLHRLNGWSVSHQF